MSEPFIFKIDSHVPAPRSRGLRYNAFVEALQVMNEGESIYITDSMVRDRIAPPRSSVYHYATRAGIRVTTREAGSGYRVFYRDVINVEEIT